MKKLFFIATILMAILVSASCSKSSGNEPESKDEYYVKYEATNTTRYTGDVSEISITTDEGLKTFIGGRNFTETFGPVKKGFVAKITCTNKAHSNTSIIVTIHVSKNNGPFALKETVSGTESASASYTIDF